ncbi:ankyrin repeat-containing domain protein [Cladorrhinum samala]|uniref:Ankyrin repeat-containing domain protein n=1 Tax=Cladorrhinum samala TaxID=585594 RepID=A0AAV9HHV9_9PEZI|nr:ankyrin repeat-containing domain protein [Cladorrhinum samala]
MRLLRTDLSDGRLELQEFAGDCREKYAILSHVWGESELTIQDVQASVGQTKKGYSKVINCCSRAKSDGFDYVWIDTCCIDKTSSAELSEAINSMYRWYQDADVCYVHLADVPSVPFPDSRWFTRGWTLQELIAPSVVVFVDENWRDLGTKATLQEAIMRSTNIPAAVLAGNGPSNASVAQRMSWAARRQTTRVEDIAYCLLGIFGVNMPLLYGEGERAFIRLQEEIIRTSDDQSIFAWRSDDSRSGLLATGPAAFADSGNVIACSHPGFDNGPMSISNRGVHLSIPFIGLDGEGLGLGLLNCTKTGSGEAAIAVYLRDTLLTMDRFERVWPGEFELLDLSKTGPAQRPVRSICVKLGRLGHASRGAGGLAKEPCRGGDDAGRPRASLLSSVLMGNPVMRNDAANTRTELFRLASRGDLVGVCRLLGSGIIPANLTNAVGKTALLYAAENGHRGLVWLLLTRQDMPPSSADVNGWTALSHAARGGHKDVVESLLARTDMRPYVTDSAGRTPLSHAAETGQDGVIRALLASGKFEPDAADSNGKRPLFYAVREGHASTARLLIETGRVDVYAKIDNVDLLCWAIQKQAQDLATMLINRGVMLEREYRGKTPLATAAAAAAGEALVSLLLDKGANVEATDVRGMTPLALAVESGSVASVRLLLAKGARSNVSDRGGMTPLGLAVVKGDAASAKLLLGNGANVEVADHGITPLALAADKGNAALVRLLLEKGANIEVGLASGVMTPLVLAAKSGDAASVKLLLERGAKPEAKDYWERTPLAWAARKGDVASAKLLLDKGANVEAPDKDRMTPLAMAAKLGMVAVAELLVEKGANARGSKESRSALAWASGGGHEGMVRMLIAKGVMVEASAFDAAAESGHLKVFQILAEGCPDISQIPTQTGAKIAYRCVMGRGKKDEIDTQNKMLQLLGQRGYTCSRHMIGRDAITDHTAAYVKVVAGQIVDVLTKHGIKV